MLAHASDEIFCSGIPPRGMRIRSEGNAMKIPDYSGLKIPDEVLDSLPEGAIRELSAATLREYSVRVRAQRNKYRAEAAQLRQRLESAIRDVKDARNA